MLTLGSSAVRIWLCVEPVDLRKSFSGLSGVVRQTLLEDPLSGHVFTFVNRRRTLMKMLVYDRIGFWIFYRRLSRGTFQLPVTSEGTAKVVLDFGELSLILEGIDLRTARRRLRHRPGPARLAQK
jgi:transposase